MQSTTSKGAFEATLNGQNRDGVKLKPIKECLCGDIHKFIDCPYLFAEVYKAGQSLKPEVENKVKEALPKVYNRIKRALKRAKAKLEKKSSNLTLTPGAPPAVINRLGNFAAQYYFRPGNFILAYKRRPTLTPKF